MIRYWCIILLTLFPTISFGQTEFEDTPTWAEEFDYKGKPDSTIWSYIIGMRGQEAEYYTNSLENVYVKQGKLHIKAIKQNVGKAICTSGRIHTQHKVSLMYGKLDIRAKLPTGKGIWPAFWMLPIKPLNIFPYGEIDIMEYIDCWNSAKYQANVHIVSKQGNKVERKQNSRLAFVDVSKYHVYSLEWTPEELSFLIDGKVFHTCTKKDNVLWPFNQPYYLILNVAYGAWGGSCGMDESIFPCIMKVDWIRYYKIKAQ